MHTKATSHSQGTPYASSSCCNALKVTLLVVCILAALAGVIGLVRPIPHVSNIDCYAMVGVGAGLPFLYGLGRLIGGQCCGGTQQQPVDEYNPGYRNDHLLPNAPMQEHQKKPFKKAVQAQLNRMRQLTPEQRTRMMDMVDTAIQQYDPRSLLEAGIRDWINVPHGWSQEKANHLLREFCGK